MKGPDDFRNRNRVSGWCGVGAVTVVVVVVALAARPLQCGPSSIVPPPLADSLSFCDSGAGRAIDCTTWLAICDDRRDKGNNFYLFFISVRGIRKITFA